MESKGTVIITGTSRGIGHHLAQHLLESGFTVLGASRTPSPIQHARFEGFQVDVTDESQVNAMLAVVRQRHTRIDVLINNAGTASMNHLFTTPMSSVRRIIDTNFVGTFLLSRGVGRLMQKNRYGRIVNIVSVAAPLRITGESVYAASKAAVVTFTEVLAAELSPSGITVNAVGPTAVDTDLIRGVPPEKIAHVLERQAIPRVGDFADVANVVDFFISPRSSFVTGQTIYLGGVQ